MKKEIEIFDNQFGEILGLIKSARQKVLKSVNAELIDLYWNAGKFISENCSKINWGNHTVELFSQFIHEKEPEIKGFSAQNIWRMKQFYETYCDDKNSHHW